MQLITQDYKVAIIMAVYQPNPNFFYQQIISIKKQTHNNFICFCLGDGPHEKLFEHAATIISDPRFQFIENKKNVGFYNNFKRGLNLITDEFSFIAFSDQDDIWHPENLEKKISCAIQTNSELIYSDARLIDTHNQIIAPSFYKYSELSKATSPIETLLINNLIGMSMVFSSKALKLAIPMPPKSRVYKSFHDWWLGLVASSTVKISFLDEQTVDYRQHTTNLVGSGGERTVIRKIRTCVRCIIIYPFYPKYCIVRYCKRNFLYKDLQKKLMRLDDKQQKVSNLKLTFKDLIKISKRKNTKLFSFCWIMMLAQAYLAFKPTRRMALKIYRQVKNI